MLRYLLRYGAADVKLPERGTFLIGRDEACDLRVDDTTVSRVHARIRTDHAELWLEDAGSENGTLLNGAPVAGPTRLQQGDLISLAGHEFSIRAFDVAVRQARDMPTGRIAPGALVPPASALLESGRKTLVDPALPGIERFVQALRLVEALLERHADRDARELLALAIDALAHEQSVERLPAMYVDRAKACLQRWPDLLEDRDWQERRHVLDAMLAGR